MFEVHETEAVAGLPKVGRKDQGAPDDAEKRGGERGSGSGPRGDASHPGHGVVADIAQIVGMPVDHLPPEAQAAMVSLLKEIEHLRQEVALRRNHEAWLERLSDQHGVLPVLNRRALLREMTRAIHGALRTQAPSAVAILAITNLPDIHLARGLMAADAAMAHVARQIEAVLDEPDIVGSLGWGGFALLLIGVDAAEGTRRVSALAEGFRQGTWIWEGEPIPLTIQTGVAEVQADDAAAAVLARADRALRRNAESA